MTTTVRLRDVGATYGGLTGKTKTDFGRGDATFVTFLEVINNTRLRGRALERVRVAKGERQSRVMRGDLIFNGSSETPEEVALSAVVDFDPDASTYLNSFCFGFRLRPGSEVDPTYLAYLFRSSVGRSLVASLAQGATRYNIAKTKFLDVQLALPSVDRQREIVETLGDTDDLIGALKRKIAKQQAIKQGMMQQLLTGRTRLPGFDGRWVARPLAELLAYEQPGRYLVSNTDYTDAGTPVLTAGKSFVLGRTTDRHGIYYAVPVIIFDDFTTASKYVDFPFKAKSSAMKMLSARTGVNLRFAFERMQLIDFVAVDHKRRWIAEYSKIAISAPEQREQDQIAAVAEAADREISALVRRLAKARAVKTGMMQQLLGGRTRLPLESTS